MAMLKSSIEGGIFGEGPVATTRVRPTRDHDIFAPDHSPPVKPARRPASAIAKADAPRSTPLLGLGSLEWSGSAEFKPARPLKMKLDPSTMEVAGIFKPAEVERPVTPRSAASNTSSVEGGIFAPNMAPPPQVLAPLRATDPNKSSIIGGIFGAGPAPPPQKPARKSLGSSSITNNLW